MRPFLLAAALTWAAPSASRAAFPVERLDVKVSTASPVRPGAKGECQPEDFIPGKTKYKKVRINGWPPELYKVDGSGESENMNIDGWGKEGEAKVRLPEAFDLTVYQFGCASSTSYVLDLKKAGRRHALYQHVVDYRVDPKRLTLYLNNSRRMPDGRYEGFLGLVDIPTKKKTRFAHVPCLAGGSFAGPWYVSNSGQPAELPADRRAPTTVCAWGLDGGFQGAFRAPLSWSLCGNAYCLNDAVGPLPKEPDTFYFYSAAAAGDRECRLYLRSLKDAGRMREFRLGLQAGALDEDGGKSYRCPPAEFDLEALSMGSEAVSFREDRGKGAAAPAWRKAPALLP